MMNVSRLRPSKEIQTFLPKKLVCDPDEEKTSTRMLYVEISQKTISK